MNQRLVDNQKAEVLCDFCSIILGIKKQVKLSL